MRTLARIAGVVVSGAALAQQPFVKIDSATIRPVARFGAPPSGSQSLVVATACADDALARQGDFLAGGGALDPLAFASPSTVSCVGAVSFFARVNGALRNQGIFTADASGVHEIAIGCGAGGGSGDPGADLGDPSPIGGRFSGFFEGAPFAPARNTAGDVLFVADVSGGASTRGLFLYEAASASIVKVAAVGDPSPAGGTLGGVGPGSLNDAKVVVFLAFGSSTADTQVLRWRNGVLAKIAAIGDPSPSGTAFQALGAELHGFADGTWIPTGPAPAIDSAGDIAFRGATAGERGLVRVSFNGSASWIVRAGEPAPGGGSIFDLSAPILDDSGRVAFFADVQSSSGFGAGWYFGKPGNWNEALALLDPIDGGQCIALAVSRNPFHPLSGGDLVVWTRIQYPAGPPRDALVLARLDGTRHVIRRQGDATALGGSVGAIGAWPSLSDAGQVTLDCGLAGVPGVTSAHFLVTLCPLVRSYCTAGTSAGGCVPSISGAGLPSASSASGFTIQAAGLPGQRSGLFFYGVEGRAAWPWGTGTSWLCIEPMLQRSSTLDSGGTAGACDGVLAFDFNQFRATNPFAVGQPLQPGERIQAQAWYRDPGASKDTNLTDALEFWLAP